jgi:drug/metabolite transporter (DMT)-like permease
VTTALLALAGSAIIGVSDYLGGRASQRRHPIVVAFVAQATYLVIVPVLAVLLGSDGITGADLRWGLLAGVLSGTAYVVFFTALGSGRMGVVAPVTAALSAALPVVADLVLGVDLGGWQWVGLAAALTAVPIVAYTPSDTVGRTSTARVVLLAAIAGVLFAGFFMSIGRTSPDSGQWPFAASSVTATASIGLALLVARRRRAPLHGQPVVLALDLTAVASGVTGALAGACLTAALQRGPVSVAAVLGSMYPLVTVTLSARFGGERVRWWHVTGLTLAVFGASLVAL